MAVLTIRGTSGSGKSTVTRWVMARYREHGGVVPQYMEGRRQPIGYLCPTNTGQGLLPGPWLYVPGHYETDCGGCDTISFPGSWSFTFDRIRDAVGSGYHVMFEGVIIQDAVGMLIDLSKEIEPTPVHAIELSTSLADCLAGIADRRRRRGDVREVNPKNTASRIDRIRRGTEKLRAAGINTQVLDRQAALAASLEVLGWPSAA